MSIKTSFKRLALSLVVALGFGVLGVAPASNAAVLGETLVIDAATDTAFTTDSATAVLTLGEPRKQLHWPTQTQSRRHALVLLAQHVQPWNIG